MKINHKFMYHMIDQDLWLKIDQEKYYSPPSLINEGFIHFSYLSQVSSVVDRFYSNVANLLVLKIEIQKLESPLKIEKVGEDGEFPHLFGKLNLNAVKDVYFFRTNFNDNLFWNGKIIKKFPI